MNSNRGSHSTTGQWSLGEQKKMLLDMKNDLVDVGPLTPIKNIGDPHVQELGWFAIMEHNKDTGEQLVFRRVLYGMMQEKSAKVFGIELMGELLYYLLVEAQNPSGVVSTYKGRVFQFYLNGTLTKILFDLIKDAI